jgi:hypothetical protein
MPDPKDDDLEGVPVVGDTVRPAAPADGDLYSSQTVVRAVNPTLLAAARDGRQARLDARNAKPQEGRAGAAPAAAPPKPSSKALPTLPLPSATLLGALVAPGAQPPRPPSRAGTTQPPPRPGAAQPPTRAALPPPTPPPPKSSPGSSAAPPPARGAMPARAMPIARVAYDGLPSRAGAPPPPPPSSRPAPPSTPAPPPAASVADAAVPPAATLHLQAPAPAAPAETASPQLLPSDVVGTPPAPGPIEVPVAPRSQVPRVLPAMTARSMQSTPLDRAIDFAQQNARPVAIGAAVFVLLLVVLIVRAC